MLFHMTHFEVKYRS